MQGLGPLLGGNWLLLPQCKTCTWRGTVKTSRLLYRAIDILQFKSNVVAVSCTSWGSQTMQNLNIHEGERGIECKRCNFRHPDARLAHTGAVKLSKTST